MNLKYQVADDCKSVPSLSILDARIKRGLESVHRMKSRENAGGSENPSRYAVALGGMMVSVFGIA